MKVEAFAPAKINLALHVTGQRPDGYHLLDSYVTFADVGDRVEVRAADRLTLEVTGRFAADVPKDDGNLVLRAARYLGPGRGAAITLHKNLPVFAGIGGGSSDAAASLRALSQLWDLPLPDDVLSLGADVPVCLAAAPRRMRGIGEHLSPVPAHPPLWAVLCNPGNSAPTPAIFSALRNKKNPTLEDISEADFLGWLGRQRNDLQIPATKLVPEIATCLDALQRLEGARLARMSGSGATCFAIFLTEEAATAAADTLGGRFPQWWAVATALR